MKSGDDELAAGEGPVSGSSAPENKPHGEKGKTGRAPSQTPMELANEFARVKVERDESGNGPRLKITSVVLNRTIYLDPLELESLTWQSQETFARFLESPFGPEDH